MLDLKSPPCSVLPIQSPIDHLDFLARLYFDLGFGRGEGLEESLMRLQIVNDATR